MEDSVDHPHYRHMVEHKHGWGEAKSAHIKKKKSSTLVDDFYLSCTGVIIQTALMHMFDEG